MNKLFGNLGLGSSCSVQLTFAGSHRTVSLRGRKGEIETLPVFTDKDTVSGSIKVSPVPGKRLDHQGIRVQLVGEVELLSERGNAHEFLVLVRELAPPGELFSQQTYPFEFKSVEMEHESYRGGAARLRYVLRVTVSRSLGGSLVKEYPFWVRNPTPAEEILPPGPPIKMEVGIEDCLHIEFEYNKAAYHLKDTVLGKIYFLLVRIKLKYMEIELRRRETTGAGASARVDTETVAKFEIMDGAPARGEIIPIRMHLAPYELTPTYPNVHNRFGVKYMLNLVLVDDEDRRYFKQQEVRLYRLADGSAGEKEANDGGNGSSVGGNAAGDSLTPRTVGRALAGAVQRPASASPRAEGDDGKLEGERQ